MTNEQALQIVQQQLTEHRYEHTLGVIQSAKELAERFNGSLEKAEMAAIFHDYAKFRPKDEMRRIIIEQNIGNDLLEYSSELWHAPVGAYLVHKEVGVSDYDVLQAIKSHTTGRVEMTLLEKIIFLADYIEPGRNFPGVDQVREMAQNNLDEAVLYALANTIQFLISRKQLIYPETVDTYNYFVRQSKKLQ